MYVYLQKNANKSGMCNTFHGVYEQNIINM